MRLYEDDPYNGLERLKRCAQNFYDEVLEVIAVWDTLGIEYDEIRHGIVRAIENCIIKTADADAITKYERFLEIGYDDGLPDLEFRRAMVAAAFIGTRHIGRPEILDLMRLFTDRTGTVEFEDGTISIWVDGYLSDEMAFLNMLLKKIPAHLGLRITVIIRRESRMELPFSWAGATGSMIDGQPPDTRRRDSLDLGAVHAARVRSVTEGDYPDIHRTYETDLDVSQGGAMIFSHDGDMVSQKRASTIDVPISREANVRMERANDIADPAPRLSRLEQPAATGSAIFIPRDPAQPAPPEPKQSSIQAPSGGGAFLRSHITSQLIRTEDDDA